MSQDLLKQILDCPRLPSLPAIAVEVVSLCRGNDTSIKDIARTVTNDPALTTKILRTVNSSYYGLSQSVSTINHALVILGLNSVRSLALGFTLVGCVRDIDGSAFDLNYIWRRCLYSAVAARSISQRIGHGQHEEAFIGGLLQDLGVIAMLQTLGPQYIDLLKTVGEDHSKLRIEERKTLHIDHAQVGEALALGWKLPAVLAAPIRFHEEPERAPANIRPTVQAIALGAKAAEIFLGGNAKAALDDYHRLAREWFHLDTAAASDLLGPIGAGTQEMAKLFEMPGWPTNDVNVLLAEASETLIEISLRTELHTKALEQTNKELLQKSDRDALTGIANRGCFNEFIVAQFDQATRQVQPLSMIMMDADKFKSVNDTHGHPAGDQVLIAIAGVLKAHAPAAALAARYGGEEFAVVLPKMDRKEAAAFAERLRLAIEATEIDAGGDLVLRITVSMGVASYDGVGFYKSPAQLIQAADRAVYAAKSAGRNCIRVFSPRVPQPAAC